jgi:hypothetical protein
MSVRKKWVSIAMCVGLVAASAALFAAEDAIHPCASVRDSTERLACYDQAFGKPAEPVAPAVAVAPKAHFGFKEMDVRRQSGQSAEPAAPTSVSAAITSLARLHDGKFVVTLDNAQVWSQSEVSSQADVKIGDAITVRRGLLGSYLLVTKAGIATRVKRVK